MTSSDQRVRARGAVWRASRAAVKRRRLQTFVIGFVVLLSTATIVLGLGLVTASAGPFDQAFAAQRGAHATVAFDPARTGADQITAALRADSAVADSAGPFAAVHLAEHLPGAGDLPPIQTTLVGRSGPDGAVDKLDLYQGRWATGPGEVVLEGAPGEGGPAALGDTLTYDGGLSLTVVGFATSVTQTADGWISPDQAAALRPAAYQVLVRFAAAPRDADAAAAAVRTLTAGLPAGSLEGSRSYLVDRQNAKAGPETYSVFLMVFGILALAVAVLIVGNVVSGTVVAGWRHIGVLKAIGFTPKQVVAVYLLMMSIPALAGSVLGAAGGDLLARPMLRSAFEHYGSTGGVQPWVLVAALVGMPLLVAAAALLPALRAGRLAAVQALSAGATQQKGRALRVQRRLTGTRLPRSVSLGVGLPFARPARSLMTLAAVVLGVMTVTFASGLSASLTQFTKVADRSGVVQVEVHTAMPGTGMAVASRTPDQITALLRTVPGGAAVIPFGAASVQLAGATQSDFITFYPADGTDLGFVPLQGRWLDGPHEIAGTSGFLHKYGLKVGDTTTVSSGGRHVAVTVAGELAGKGSEYWGDYQTLTELQPDAKPLGWGVKLAPGVKAGDYQRAVQQADPGLHAGSTAGSGGSFILMLKSFAALLTVMLGTVAALGVFNTVVLNTRERRRDLGMLKSIGMTPRQVTVMVLTSMAGLGLAGGLLGIPLGMAAHRVVMPLMGHTAGVAFPAAVLHVFDPARLALFAAAGVAIAVAGALLPARSAARLTIAEVLHSE